MTKYEYLSKYSKCFTRLQNNGNFCFQNSLEEKKNTQITKNHSLVTKACLQTWENCY